MAIVQVTEQNFEEATGTGIVLLDLWAGWCGPCRIFAPVFEAAADRHPDVIFGKIDTEAEAQLASALRIRAIPTLMVFREGVLLASQPGVLPGTVLDDVIREVRELDMEEVRARIKDHATQNGQTAAGS